MQRKEIHIDRLKTKIYLRLANHYQKELTANS